jgi:hypothetical protein
MTRISAQTSGTTSLGVRRIAAALGIALCLAAIAVHGKASRSPRIAVTETAETMRAADRPQTR